MTKLLELDPTTRLTAAQVMAHPWCKGDAPTAHLDSAQQSLKKYNASRKLKKVRARARARLGLGLGLGLEVQGLSTSHPHPSPHPHPHQVAMGIIAQKKMESALTALQAKRASGA